MIPSHIGNFINIPRTNYILKKENEDISVYYENNFIQNISLSNFFKLYETTTFSKGKASFNLLIFIYNEEGEIELINKNDKSYKEAKKRNLKIKNIKRLSKISFLYQNEYKEGYYLGKGILFNFKKVYFVECSDYIYSFEDTIIFQDFGKNNDFYPDFSKTIKFRKELMNCSSYLVQIDLMKEFEKIKREKEFEKYTSLKKNEVELTKSAIYSLNGGELFEWKTELYIFLGRITISNSSFYVFAKYKSFEIFISYSSFSIRKSSLTYNIINLILNSSNNNKIHKINSAKKISNIDIEYLKENLF